MSPANTRPSGASSGAGARLLTGARYRVEWHTLNRHLLLLWRDLGLDRSGRFFRGTIFWSMLGVGLAAVILAAAFAPWVFAGTSRPTLGVVLSVVIIQPVIEELLFRGLLQGELRRISRRAEARFLSLPNVLSSIAFAALHFIFHPPLWALAVLIPSLQFGYLRDRYDSLWPALLLHIAYNGMFFLAATAAAS